MIILYVILFIYLVLNLLIMINPKTYFDLLQYSVLTTLFIAYSCVSLPETTRYWSLHGARPNDLNFSGQSF
jgi:hypothetical protein